MVTLTYTVTDRNTNWVGEGTSTCEDNNEAVKALIRRIENSFVYDSIEGNRVIDIHFVIDFGDEIDDFTRYYVNRSHYYTV